MDLESNGEKLVNCSKNAISIYARTIELIDHSMSGQSELTLFKHHGDQSSRKKDHNNDAKIPSSTRLLDL